MDRGGFLYKITEFGNQTDIQNRIEKDIKNTLEKIQKEYQKQEKSSKTVSQKALTNSKTQ